jgi:uncharacterized SAM-binding protein YcdF (DUF218 family)
MYRFFVKEILARLLTPTPIIGILLIFSLVLLWSNKHKLAKVFFTISVLLFFIFGFNPLTDLFLYEYESRYKKFELNQYTQNRIKRIDFIVVLAGGYKDNQQHPLTTQLSNFTLVRLIEGIKILNEMPNAKLILTGKGLVAESEASAMKRMAIKLGVLESKIIIEEKSSNTYEHVLNLKKYLKKNNFILVTSALHMKRALAYFKAAGYKPLPAPTGHLLNGKYSFFSFDFPFTTGDNFYAIDNWFYEYWGYNWAKLTGKF